MFDLVQSALSQGVVNEPISDQLDWSSFDDVISQIERELHLENAQPQEFAPHLWNPELHKDQKEFRDFIEDGYQEIWLADEPKAPDFKWPPDNSLRLNFGLNYEEWKSIFVLELGATRLRMIEDGPGEPFPYAVDDEYQQYPLLSRLKDTNETARYAAEEVSDFKDECLTLAQRAKSQTSVRGLDKLVIATSWAGHLGYGMVFIDTEA